MIEPLVKEGLTALYMVHYRTRGRALRGGHSYADSELAKHKLLELHQAGYEVALERRTWHSVDITAEALRELGESGL